MNVNYAINEKQPTVELTFKGSDAGHIYIHANGMSIAYLSRDGYLGPTNLNAEDIPKLKELGFKIKDDQIEIHGSCKQKKSCWGS